MAKRNDNAHLERSTSRCGFGGVQLERHRWDMAEWLPAITASGMTGVLLALLSIPYKRAVEASISAVFDSRIEKAKSDFRLEEEKLRSELARGRADIDALRSGAISGLNSRQAELSRRRIQAVETVWNSVVELGRFKMISGFAQSLKMDAFISAAEARGSEGEKIRDFADSILKGAKALEPQRYEHTPDAERPFIPEITWALFSAYRLLISRSVFQLHLAKSGLGPKLMADGTQTLIAVKTALPHQSAFLDEHGAAGLPFLLDELEGVVLKSLRDALSDAEGDAGAVEQASRISAAVRAASPQASVPGENCLTPPARPSSS